MLSLEKLSHRSHFPPEDMCFNDSLRWRYRNGDTASVFTTQLWGRGVLCRKLMLYNNIDDLIFLLWQYWKIIFACWLLSTLCLDSCTLHKTYECNIHCYYHPCVIFVLALWWQSSLWTLTVTHFSFLALSGLFMNYEPQMCMSVVQVSHLMDNNRIFFL